MIFSIFLLISGIACIIYDIVLLIVCPGTLLNVIFTFRHIWLFAGLILIYVSIFRIKTKKSFWKALSKKIRMALLSLFSIALFISLINLFYILTPESASENDNFEYIILLGGGIDKNGNLPESVKLRAKKAARVVKANPTALCVVSGGKLTFVPYPEGPAIKAELVKNGIDENIILIEDKALDTIENFKYSVQLLSDFTGKTKSDILSSRVCVVTSRFHLARSLRLARRMGFTNVKGIGSRTSKVTLLHNYVKEICSYVKLNLRIIFTGKPEKIFT